MVMWTVYQAFATFFFIATIQATINKLIHHNSTCLVTTSASDPWLPKKHTNVSNLVKLV